MGRIVAVVFFVAVSAIPVHSQSLESDWFLAALEGNTPRLEALLSEGVEVDVRGREGETALMLASGNGHVDSVRALLRAGAEADARDHSGVTPLMAGAATGDVEVVRLLLDSGADPRRRSENGAGPLILAALGGPHGEVIRVLLSAGADLEELIIALAHEEPVVRMRAVMALAFLGPDVKSAVPALAGSLRDKNLNVRFWAASALKKIGAGAEEAVPDLVEALKTHPDRTPGLEGPPRYYADVRWLSAEALGAIGSPDAEFALQGALHDEHPQVRAAAAEALERIAAAARSSDAGLSSSSDEPVPLGSPSVESTGTIPAGPLPSRPDPPTVPALVNQRVAWTDRTETAVAYEWHAVLSDGGLEDLPLVITLRLHDAEGQVIYQTEEKVEAVASHAAVELQGTGQVNEAIALKGDHWTLVVNRSEASR